MEELKNELTVVAEETELENKNSNVEEDENVITNIEETPEGFEELVSSVVDNVDPSKYKKTEWWNALRRGDKFFQGDIVFNEEIERFGIFVAPALKENLIRVRLFKRNTKYDIYTRDWFVDYDKTTLVKRRTSDNVQKGFVDTNKEFLERPDRIKARIGKVYNIEIQ